MQVRLEETVSITQLQRGMKEAFERIESGTQDKFVVLRNNQIAGVLLSAQRYEALLDEIDDLRMLNLAASRLESLDPDKTISHDQMLTRFMSDEDV